jgi:gliding motility-associated-like protein
MYQVTISDGCSTPATANVTVNVNPTPKGSFQADIRQGCVPLKIKLTAASNGTNDAYLWNVGVGPSGSGQSYEVTYNTAGTYSVALQITSSQGCRVDSVAVNYITVHDYPYANFHADKYDVDLLDPVVQFVNTSQNAATYLWDFGTGTAPTHTTTTANPSFEYSSPGTYTVFLEATNAFGCKDYTTLNIKVNPEFYIWVPNAFSPNDDGINDVFQPKGFGIIEGRYSLQIFDRWGELIWSTTDFPTGWDGHVKKGNLDNSVKADVYIYKIVTTDMKGKIHEKTGHVSLLR